MFYGIYYGQGEVWEVREVVLYDAGCLLLTTVWPCCAVVLGVGGSAVEEVVCKCSINICLNSISHRER